MKDKELNELIEMCVNPNLELRPTAITVLESI